MKSKIAKKLKGKLFIKMVAWSNHSNEKKENSKVTPYFPHIQYVNFELNYYCSVFRYESNSWSFDQQSNYQFLSKKITGKKTIELPIEYLKFLQSKDSVLVQMGVQLCRNYFWKHSHWKIAIKKRNNEIEN